MIRIFVLVQYNNTVLNFEVVFEMNWILYSGTMQVYSLAVRD